MRIIIYMELKVNDYLTWQSASSDQFGIIPEDILLACQPRTVDATMPDWWNRLTGNVAQSAKCPVHGQEIIEQHGLRSAKHCLGLRGVKTVGYTIPMLEQVELTPSIHNWQKFYNTVRDSSWPTCDTPEQFDQLPDFIKKECQEVHGYRTDQLQHQAHLTGLKTVELHPEMLHGSIWTEKKANGDYRWRIILLSWPWRAKMSPGWRILNTTHPFHWSRSWYAFSGCVDANYKHDGYSINRFFWNFDHEIDTDFYYYNIETVIAIDADCSVVNAGDCLFSMVPVWDPQYQPKKHKRHPSYN